MGEDSTCPFTRGTASALNKAWEKTGRKSRFKAVAHTTIQDAEFNRVDCAIGMPLDSKDIGESIINIGPIQGQVRGELGMAIKKQGRTTDYTESEIIQTDVTVSVSYGGGKIGIFEDQLMAGAMSAGGDSGSAVLSSDDYITGLLFAGSDSTTIINRIENVFSALKISI
jgi:hypothetical protein